MKLRNKKTGVTRDLQEVIHQAYQEHNYDSLAELNAEWEDYEAPKTHWYIYGAEPFEVDESDWDKEFIEELKSIGNYFETKEEAELAVRKLKAWKRLKDKGFRFKGWAIPEEPKTPHIKLVIEAEMDVPDSPYDLDLLFLGGEE